ncbi:MAG: uracil-DNA glycosylase [Phycisphaerales bacterium]|jgi:uracil-DNA glycosylase family 4|nr:uracil-DNA glycosylase [Phycisphaerales bacterium]
MDTTKLRAIAAQHAETARLLGVDFVPMYRAGGPRAGEPAPARTTGTGEGVAARATVREAGAREATARSSAVVEVEVKEPRASATRDADVMESAGAKGVPVAGGGAGLCGEGERDRAAAQRELDEIRARYEKDAPHKAFVTHFNNIVFGEGDPCARLMFIGEAPGEEEDKTGRPFVGRAGKLLSDMIVAMGLTREGVYIANVLKTRPPNNATPTGEECKLCKPYLFEQVAAIKPEAIVTLGLPATRTVLDTTEAMGKLRGRWAEFRDPRGRVVPVMPTYHPAYLLRNYTPEERRKVWSDLKMVMERLGARP